MQTSKTAPVSKRSTKNPFEAVSEIGHGVGKATADTAKTIGSGVLDSFLGDFGDDFDLWENELAESAPKHAPEKHKEAPKPTREHRPVFNFAEHHETVEVQKQIQELLQIIHNEIKVLEQQNNALLSDVKDIENAALSELPETPGVYHVRFFETLLSIVRSLREKVGESATWLEAMMSKKKKRGSLFSSRSKDQGTQYSLSQEIQVTRSVQ